MKDQEMTEKLIVKSEDEGKVIVIRHDNPKKVYEPKTINLSGSIFAPTEFIKKRKGEYDALSVHVVYDKKAGTIILNGDERSNFGTTVTGTLKKNPKLEEFRINGKERPIKEFTDMIRFNRWLFLNDDDHAKLVDNLLRFKANLSQEFTSEDDVRGNKGNTFIQKVNSTANLSFTASAAIFLGAEPVKFKCDVVCEVRNAAIGFWIESIEYADLEEQQKDAIFTEQLDLLKEYVCIEK